MYLTEQYTRSVEWRDLDEFPSWIISSNGDVMNEWTSKVMSVRYNQQNLKMVNLVRDGQICTRLVSLLVAKTFLEPPRDPHRYNSVIHLNGDRDDCRAMNLMWRPRWFAMKYHRMFERDPIRVAVYVPKLDKVFFSLREFCTTYGLIERDTYHALNNGEGCFQYGWYLERYIE